MTLVFLELLDGCPIPSSTYDGAVKPREVKGYLHTYLLKKLPTNLKTYPFQMKVGYLTHCNSV